jgi:hypothetical protein
METSPFDLTPPSYCYTGVSGRPVKPVNSKVAHLPFTTRTFHVHYSKTLMFTIQKCSCSGSLFKNMLVQYSKIFMLTIQKYEWLIFKNNHVPCSKTFLNSMMRVLIFKQWYFGPLWSAKVASPAPRDGEDAQTQSPWWNPYLWWNPNPPN